MKTNRLLLALAIMLIVIGSCGCANILRVYKYGPTTFSVGDLNVDSAAMRLKTKEWPVGRPDPVSKLLGLKLDEQAHQAVEEYTDLRTKVQESFSDSGRKQLKAIADTTGIEAILTTNFNRIVQGPCIYEKKGFRNYLSLQSQYLLKLKPNGNELVRLNWLLLQDALFASSRGAIEADGEITGIFAGGSIQRKERILHIEIFPNRLSALERQDIWIAFSPTDKVALSDITEDKIKPEVSRNFQFEKHKLVKVNMQTYGYGYTNLEARDAIRVGSKRNRSSLALPSSIEDFERVFGKADEIQRATMW